MDSTAWGCANGHAVRARARREIVGDRVASPPLSQRLFRSGASTRTARRIGTGTRPAPRFRIRISSATEGRRGHGGSVPCLESLLRKQRLLAILTNLLRSVRGVCPAATLVGTFRLHKRRIAAARGGFSHPGSNRSFQGNGNYPKYGICRAERSAPEDTKSQCGRLAGALRARRPRNLPLRPHFGKEARLLP